MHGGHQEEGFRAGTESVHNIAGFGAACQEVNKLLEKSEKIRTLTTQFTKRIQKIYPDCIINSPVTDCVPNTISITFPDISNAGLVALMDYHGISISAGSACSMPEDKPSHVLKAIGLSDQEAQETLRISLGSDTTKKDIRYTLQVFQKSVEGRTLLVDMIKSEEVDKEMLFNDQVYILDIRPQFLRRKIKSLPNSHEASFFSIKKYLKQLPRDKRIIVVCQHGNLSYITTYFLRSSGLHQVSSLWAGILGWKEKYNELYQEYAGKNITVLQPSQ
jgi:rhodanese-related sulfurtransferase